MRRSHIIANRHRYVGKETSRRWEQGEDMSLVDFRCAEYSDGKMVADQDTRTRIIKIGIREVARQSGLDRETVAFVARGNPIKAITLYKLINALGS